MHLASTCFHTELGGMHCCHTQRKGSCINLHPFWSLSDTVLGLFVADLMCLPQWVWQKLPQVKERRTKDLLINVMATALYYNATLAVSFLQQQQQLTAFLTTWAKVSSCLKLLMAESTDAVVSN